MKNAATRMEAGRHKRIGAVPIMDRARGSLDEHAVCDLLATGAPMDAFAFGRFSRL